MPALPSYMPTREADFTPWLAISSTLISANPPAYGLMTTDAANIAAQNAAWAAVYGLVSSPATKTFFMRRPCRTRTSRPRSACRPSSALTPRT